MRIFDAHAHIADPKFDEDRPDVISRMREAGVERCVIVSDPCDETTRVEEAFALAEANAGYLAAAGVHPHNASAWSDAAEVLVRARLAHPKSAALGEIGLDYHYDLSPREAQREVFARELDIAYECGRPAILHIREAFGDAMDILGAAVRAGRLPVCQMHCFSGSWETAKQCLNMDMYISFSGSVTFKNGVKLLETAEKMPLDRLLVETDCPYLSPEPLRGRRNEPSHIVHTVRRVAEIRNTDPEALAEAAFENACRLFVRGGAQ